MLRQRRTRHRRSQTELTPQQVDGLTSNGEWTGVPLATLLREVGVSPTARLGAGRGGRRAMLARSVPIAKALDDALVAYAQNGEALRSRTATRCACCCPAYEGNM